MSSDKEANLRRKYNLWADSLREQDLCETMNKMQSGFDEQRQVERDVESYHYPVKFCSSSTTAATTSIDSKEDVTNRLKNVWYDESIARPHIRVCELDSNEAVCREIVRHLREPNTQIIARCVQVLGRKKSLELLYATEDLFKMGGLLTSDGARRRTFGGVYMQLVRRDETILGCQKKEIFIEEYEKKKFKKKLKRKRLRQTNKKVKEGAKQDEEDDSSSNLTEPDKTNKMESKEDIFEEIEEEGMIYFE